MTGGNRTRRQQLRSRVRGYAVLSNLGMFMPRRGKVSRSYIQLYLFSIEQGEARGEDLQCIPLQLRTRAGHPRGEKRWCKLISPSTIVRRRVVVHVDLLLIAERKSFFYWDNDIAAVIFGSLEKLQQKAKDDWGIRQAKYWF